MSNLSIKPFKAVRPKIYCYTTPNVSYHNGWVKIGYTEQNVADRIYQQTHTVNIQAKLEWQELAQYKDDAGGAFTDREFHAYLANVRNIEREANTEWFHIEPAPARSHFNDFADRRSVYNADPHITYTLRAEQEAAVAKTCEYFKNGGTEFLWNAKPRFGKTLAAYDLALRMGVKSVLVVTNRPSIANSWADDFNTFIGWRNKFLFVSELDSIKNKKGVHTRSEYLNAIKLGNRSTKEIPGFIEFESLQNIKGSVHFGGNFDKLSWLCAERIDERGSTVEGLTFDLLIIDESHEGVDTVRTDRAFENISARHTLCLSGTPFKALADGRFSESQLFNWTYADEQAAKSSWGADSYNPYEPLPKLSMFTYQLSNIIYSRIQRGLDLSNNIRVDYAFDLNEFFSVSESGKFLYEEDVKKFLHALSTNEKYPFSTPELRADLSHTLWLLNRVASAKALAKLLKEDPIFKEYEIILAAGDGRLESTDAGTDPAFNRVKKAIKEHDKTITLSVGQLTVGVTIPEWSGVLMLCNMQSPSAYMQAAFRAQNPCLFTRIGADGKEQTLRKQTAYVFDFDPSRTLIIFDEFANNLSPNTAAGRGTAEQRRQNIGRLLNFFPVLGEDTEGKMVELNAAEVLSIPRRLKSAEVVRRGFMSNFLFQNISHVFNAPAPIQEILEKLTPSREEPRNKKNNLEGIDNVNVDESGNVQVPNGIVIGKAQNLFGEKIYENLQKTISPSLTQALNSTINNVEQNAKELTKTITQAVKEKIIAPAVANYAVSKSAKTRIERQEEQEIEKKITNHKETLIQQTKIAAVELEKQRKEAETKEDIARAEDTFKATIQKAQDKFQKDINETVHTIIQNKPAEVVQKLELQKAEEKKKEAEDAVRDHLRGFSRTIPSFIMAYGDENLTLSNFDDYTEDDVFQEVTGITEADFRFLRDGGDYTDQSTGKTVHFVGHLFDETVFNDSIKEFLRKKTELANYFQEDQQEDIFDYIPPQKTNQIFTPRWVVEKMVDQLEAENPGCFNNPSHTFADLYMKSGLYITEIVKRLCHSQGLKTAFPNNEERIRHILRHQVYGMAPTRIIYLIATNYILGFDAALKKETTHFVQADAAEAAKNGTLKQLVEKHFGQIP